MNEVQLAYVFGLVEHSGKLPPQTCAVNRETLEQIYQLLDKAVKEGKVQIDEEDITQTSNTN